MSKKKRVRLRPEHLCKNGKTKVSLYRAAEIMVKAYVSEGLKMSAYMCPGCHHLHMTSRQAGDFTIADAIVRGIPVNDASREA